MAPTPIEPVLSFPPELLLRAQGIRLAIFDVDGTLIDSVDAHAASWVETFRRFGLEVGHAAGPLAQPGLVGTRIPIARNARVLQAFEQQLEIEQSAGMGDRQR